MLDYGCDWRLQEHPVIVVARPDGKIPFLNITSAGLVGCVTGINAERISVGLMGGQGLGKWQGVRMAILMPEVLQQADRLAEAVAVFRDSPRSCEQLCAIADGKAVGMEVGAGAVATVAMGEANERLPAPLRTQYSSPTLRAGERPPSTSTYRSAVDRAIPRRRFEPPEKNLFLRLCDGGGGPSRSSGRRPAAPTWRAQEPQ